MKKTYLILPILIAVLVLVGAGCDVVASSTRQEATAIESTQKRLIDSTPIPQLTRSVERENIVRRAKTFDAQNKVTYIYLINYGKVMAFFTVDGKVSSLNSFISPSQRIVRPDGSPCTGYDTASSGCVVLESPDIDGAYGENDGGIFFFTTDGAYVEWHGDYMVSDQPLKLTQQPELIREIK